MYPAAVKKEYLGLFPNTPSVTAGYSHTTYTTFWPHLYSFSVMAPRERGLRTSVLRDDPVGDTFEAFETKIYI